MIEVFLIAAMALSAPVVEPQAAMPGIRAEHIYNGVDRAALVTVTSPRSFGSVTLALMDVDGKLLADMVHVHPGRLDLGETLPGIWKIRRAAYVQVLDHQRPVGPALVVQPMLSRLVPVTESAKRPNGTPYSRIVGWTDENVPSPALVPAASPAAAPSAAETPPATAPKSSTNSTNHEQQSPAASSEPKPMTPMAESTMQETKSVERLFTGLRMYVESDVILHTSKGDIRVVLRPDKAPNTVWNFLELAHGGFYRDILFHRVVPLTATGVPFVIQAGDPTGTGDGAAGFWLPIENSQLPHDYGVISMARSDDPDSAGSQFFFCLSREGTARLDGQYCSFGYAVDGANAINAIAEVELADVAAGRPVDPPILRSAKLTPSPPRTPGQGRPDARITIESTTTQTRPSGKIPR